MKHNPWLEEIKNRISPPIRDAVKGGVGSGDLEGHEFRGNQWTGGEGRMTAKNLGNGYIMKEEGDGIFKTYDSQGNLVASALVAFHPGSDVPALDGIDAYNRNEGLGRRMVTQLVVYYGSLRSSHVGNTSESASEMWIRLGARSLRTDEVGHGRSHYILERGMR